MDQEYLCQIERTMAARREIEVCVCVWYVGVWAVEIGLTKGEGGTGMASRKSTQLVKSSEYQQIV